MITFIAPHPKVHFDEKSIEVYYKRNDMQKISTGLALNFIY